MRQSYLDQDGFSCINWPASGVSYLKDADQRHVKGMCKSLLRSFVQDQMTSCRL